MLPGPVAFSSPMKIGRLFLIGGAALLALLLVAVGLAFTSDFQTWAARRVLASQPGLRASLGRVDAGLNRVQFQQLRLIHGGATLTLPSMEITLPLLAAARRDIQIRKLVAKGWTVDLTEPAPKPAPAATAAPRPREFSLLASTYAAEPAQAAATVFQGIFALLKLPVDLGVEAVELEGEVIFPVNPGQPPARARVTLTGGQLGAGRAGKFTFTTSTTLAAAAPVHTLNASGSFTAAMDTPRTFSRLGAQVDAEARGPQFPQGARLLLALTAVRADAGESYTVAVEAGGRKLLEVHAGYPGEAGKPAGGHWLAGTWTLDVRDLDVAPFVLGRPLPAFAAKGAGKFAAEVALTGFSASGHLDAKADKLGVVRPELAALGAMKIATDFDLVQSDLGVRVTSFAAEIVGAGPVLAVQAMQPFEFNRRTGELKVAEPASDLLRLDLGGLPLAWVQPFTKGLTLLGDDVHGAFVVGARGGGFAVRAVAPLTLGGLSIALDGRPLVQAVDVSLQASADYTPQGWQTELVGVTARSVGITLLTLEARAGQLAGKDQPIKITGQWSANLPAVLAQPAAADYAVLTGGRATGDFAASLGPRREIQAKFALTGLATDPKIGSATLPALSAEVRADFDEAGKIAFNVPLLIEREGRKSDLILAGTLSPVAGGLVLDGRLTSSFFAVEDAQILAAPLAGKLPAGASPAGAPPARDPAPVWRGVSGQLALGLKQVVYQQKFEMRDVGGVVRLEAGALKLDGVRAGLGAGSDFKLSGAVNFDSKAKEPYALKADLAVNNFDSVPAFQAFDPGKSATIEGKFNLTSRLAGSGLNVAHLAERTRGEIQLSSRGGVFRALRTELSDKVQKTQAAVAALGGLLGAMTGKDRIADFANRTQIVSDIARTLAEIPFDQLSVAVTRDAGLNFNLKDFTLISPEVRLAGTGEIRHAEDTTLLAQALDLRLQLGARGKLADMMNRAGLLDGRRDGLGYVGFAVPLRVSGTLRNPDTSELRTTLLKAAGGSLLNNLLGR
ncbi:MAG: hypothetical protein EXS39_03255 [Opitutaceae bacterium]|nr:hypothetical protein [Opitutaceae bacterium]